MKISFVFMSFKGENFEMEVKPEDTVAYVKKTIENRNGADTYPVERQKLVHKGKVLEDGTTMAENEVAENSYIFVILAMNEGSRVEGSTSSPPSLKAPQTNAAPTSTTATTTPQSPAAAAAPAPTSTPAADDALDVYGQAASTLEETIRQILHMSGGNWDRAMVVRALGAAYNNPERAVEYLYHGIPESAEGSSKSASVRAGQTANNVPAQPQQAAQPAPVPSTGPNANPRGLLSQLFPSVGSNAADASTVENLRNSLQTISITGELVGAFEQAETFTREEREAIDRLEAMGFPQTTVLQVFLACNRNEELTANYLLDHMHEFDQ